MGQTLELLDLLKKLVVDTSPEKSKIEQRKYSWVWRMNRLNKLSWIKLGCYGYDMWIAFTH